jgi:DNA-binding winged helix-turn-helix (wHTH) protein
MESLPIPGGHLDLIRGQVVRDGVTTSLSSIEVAVLSVLAEHSPEPVDEAELLRRAWGYRTTKTRTVSMGVSRLRAKIEADPKSPQVVRTVRGVGYRLVLHDAVESRPELPEPTTLLGRTEALDQIAAHLRRGRRAVELVGPGGVGTTTLARAAVPGATLVPLQGCATAKTVLRRWCEALSLEGTDGEAALRRALPDAGPLVLDAASELSDEAAALVQRLLPDAEGPTLITARRPLGLGAAVVVPPLADDDALAVLQQARADAGLPAVSDEQARPVLREAAGFPLGLVLAAPLVELASAGQLGLATHPDGDLARVLRETLSHVDPDARRLLALASAFAVAPELPTLASAADQPLPAVLRPLHALRERGLVRLGDGRVDVPSAVATVARTDEAVRQHAAWAAALPPDSQSLRPHRHELQIALAVRDELLAPVLLRHLVVVHTYGPDEQLGAEVTALLPKVSDPGRRQVLLGMLLAAERDHAGAHDAQVRALGELSDDDHAFVGWAWQFRSVAATWIRRFDDALDCIEPMLAVREHVGSTQWASLTINAASLVALDHPERAAALFREVDAHPDTPPSLAITASFYRLGLEPPSSATVRFVQRQLDAVAPEVWGARRWATHHLRLGRGWLRVGEVERGLALLQQHTPAGLQLAESLTASILDMAALSMAHQPDAARRILDLSPPGERPIRRAAEWLASGARPPVPQLPEGLQQAVSAWVDGREVPLIDPYRAAGRALAQSAEQRAQMHQA